MGDSCEKCSLAGLVPLLPLQLCDSELLSSLLCKMVSILLICVIMMIAVGYGARTL
ncbi:hypothetical protein OIU78_027214 [Salix suchowensis]|nr:hypothetical protein OIU78_027214 [Salix suchowensis]